MATPKSLLHNDLTRESKLIRNAKCVSKSMSVGKWLSNIRAKETALAYSRHVRN
jgi:hypothetical protein